MTPTEYRIYPRDGWPPVPPGFAPAATDQDQIRPDGYEKLQLGMTVEMAGRADPSLVVDRTSKCRSATTKDAEIVFNPDGKLAYVAPRGPVRTPEGLGAGDPMARAFELYGAGQTPFVGANSGENQLPVQPGSTVRYWFDVNLPANFDGSSELDPSTTTIRKISLNGGQRCFN